MTSSILQEFIRAGISLLPVLFFLVALTFIDSYKLVKLKSLLVSILIGSFVAIISSMMNSLILSLGNLDFNLYSRYGAPIIEELMKAIFLVYLIRNNKIGFMVDAAIYGFAIGAGFAVLENIYYLHYVQESTLIVWVIRGFGTAIMHGGTTAIFGIIAKSLVDRYSKWTNRVILIAIMPVIFIHSFYNHFFFHPVTLTAGILISLPVVLIFVFHKSEEYTSRWLGVGFDSDQELLELITTGNFTDSKVGRYLQSLQSRFPGEVVADMLCLLRIQVELSIHAKGILLMRQAGFQSKPLPEIKEKFAELKYLEKNIGKTGKLAIAPFIHTNRRDLWQVHLLNS